MSLALARKYRPRRFAEVAVQTHVATTLRSAVEHDRVANAYLFCGPRGTGKTTLARVLAMSLNCENRRPDREPCGACPSCDRIWAGSASLDVVEIDAASNRGVDDARDLRERAMYAPTGDDRYKVYIIDEAHMLTKEAWNALLKIIEEPPPRVVFAFATTEPQKIATAAAPILSRVQRFDLRRMGPADVRERLNVILAAEKVTAEPDALAMIARAADGSMRDALSLTDQVLSLGTGAVTAQLVRDTLGLVHDDEILALLELIAAHRAGEIFTATGRLAEEGADFGLLLSGVIDALRAELAISLGATVTDVSEQMRASLEAAKGRHSPADLLRMLSIGVELEPHFRRSGQQQLLFETFLVRLALLERTLDLETVVRGIASGGTVPQIPAPQRAALAAAQPPGRVAERPERPERPREAAPTPSSPPRLRDSRVGEPAAAVQALADAAPAPVTKEPLELNRLAARWDDVVELVRGSGRAVVASALAEATPLSVKDGVVMIQVTGDALATAIENGAEGISAAMQQHFTGVRKVAVARAAESARSVPQKRMTESDVVANRVAMLRKGHPMLDAAFDALDLRLIE